MPFLFGKPVAEKILLEAKALAAGFGVVPGLGVVLVGNDEASRIYVGIKEKRAAELGFHFFKRELPKEATQEDVLLAIEALNADPSTHGIIVQLPLPPHVDADKIIAAIDLNKDADGFIVGTPVFPEAMIELAKSSGVLMAGKRAVALVNSERFGRALSKMLREEGMAVEYLFPDDIGSSRSNIAQADFVFSALGQPGILFGNMFKSGAVVIDGGVAKENEKTVGDVASDGSHDCIFLSPVPGGVGPVTVACLLRRVAKLARRLPN